MSHQTVTSQPDADVHYFKNRKEFETVYASVRKDRHEFEKHIGKINRHRRYLYNLKKVLLLANIHSTISSWYMPGICQACIKPTRFRSDWRVSDKWLPNFSLGMECEHCGTIGRNRFIMHYLRQMETQHPARQQPFRLHLYEQTTPFFRNVMQFLKQSTVTGSEYLGAKYNSGDTIQGVRHEDIQATSFASNMFDAVASIDVLEHVPDFEKALKETCRILKPGGTYIFTTPVFFENDATLNRATIEGGKIKHLQPPAYHGDPAVHPLRQFLDPSRGVLVYHDFGWDILAAMKRAGFREVYVIGYYSVLYGYLGRHGYGAMEFALMGKK